jgi:hypothetical protein
MTVAAAVTMPLSTSMHRHTLWQQQRLRHQHTAVKLTVASSSINRGHVAYQVLILLLTVLLQQLPAAAVAVQENLEAARVKFNREHFQSHQHRQQQKQHVREPVLWKFRKQFLQKDLVCTGALTTNSKHQQTLTSSSIHRTRWLV